MSLRGCGAGSTHPGLRYIAFVLKIKQLHSVTATKLANFVISSVLLNIVADAHHFDADPDPACHFDTDPDPTFHFDADPSLQIKAQNIEKVLK
jgi:hypothetical protein